MTTDRELKLEADGLKMPTTSALSAMAGDIDKVVEEVKSVLDFLVKYGKYVPGSGAVLGPVEFLDKALGIVQSLLKHVES
jgi:hypothetical protein